VTGNSSQKNVDSHYTEVSGEVGTSWSSTMLDKEIREKEIENLIRLIREIRKNTKTTPLRLLDVGCGNGYVAARIHCEFPNLVIDGVDANLSMVECANSRMLPSAGFYCSTAAQLNTLGLAPNTYDLVFSTRCFINIMDEVERYESVRISSNYVKPGGIFALMEGFESGQGPYNSVRESLGFEKIPPSWHNIYLNSEKLIETLHDSFEYLDDSKMASVGLDRHFLSNRYLAMRVLLPLFKNDPDFFNNNRNDPLGLALSYLLPKTTNYSPLQLFLWEKKSE
jgi:ubiquinone/menaquinone biosynthesis C-methylase UbiE